MWRSVLAFILVPSLIWSQNPPATPADSPQENAAETEVPTATYQPFTQMQEIRRGTTERAALMFTLGTELVVSPRNRGGEAIPLKLEFANSDGIFVEGFEFPPDLRPSTSAKKDRFRLMSGTITVHFKVKATRTATLGERVLHGKLTYQIVRGSEVFPSQVAELELPLKVVDHNASTTNNSEYTQRFGDSGREHGVLFWILLPVLIPAVAVAVLFCQAAHIDCLD